MAQIIQQRGDTHARWTEINPIIAQKEMILVDSNGDGDYNQYKVGDGIKRYNELPMRGLPAVSDLTDSTIDVPSTKLLKAQLDTRVKKDDMLVISDGNPSIPPAFDGQYFYNRVDKRMFIAASGNASPLTQQIESRSLLGTAPATWKIRYNQDSGKVSHFEQMEGGPLMRASAEPVTDSNELEVEYYGEMPEDRKGYDKTLFYGVEPKETGITTLEIKNSTLYAIYSATGWVEVAGMDFVDSLNAKNIENQVLTISQSCATLLGFVFSDGSYRFTNETMAFIPKKPIAIFNGIKLGRGFVIKTIVQYSENGSLLKYTMGLTITDIEFGTTTILEKETAFVAFNISNLTGSSLIGVDIPIELYIKDSSLMQDIGGSKTIAIAQNAVTKYLIGGDTYNLIDGDNFCEIRPIGSGGIYEAHTFFNNTINKGVIGLSIKSINLNKLKTIHIYQSDSEYPLNYSLLDKTGQVTEFSISEGKLNEGYFDIKFLPQNIRTQKYIHCLFEFNVAVSNDISVASIYPGKQIVYGNDISKLITYSNLKFTSIAWFLSLEGTGDSSIDARYAMENLYDATNENLQLYVPDYLNIVAGYPQQINCRNINRNNVARKYQYVSQDKTYLRGDRSWINGCEFIPPYNQSSDEILMLYYDKIREENFILTDNRMYSTIAGKSFKVRKIDPSMILNKSPKVLMIGDSFTNYGAGTATYKFLEKIGMTPAFIGTRRDRFNVCDIEGRPGWSFANFIGYNSEGVDIVGGIGTTSTINPFLKLATESDKMNHPECCYRRSGSIRELNYSEETDKNGEFYIFDAEFYKENNNLENLDFAIIGLGANDLAVYDVKEVAVIALQAYETMKRSIKKAFPSVKLSVFVQMTYESKIDSIQKRFSIFDVLSKNNLYTDYELLPVHLHMDNIFNYGFDPHPNLQDNKLSNIYSQYGNNNTGPIDIGHCSSNGWVAMGVAIGSYIANVTDSFLTKLETSKVKRD